MAEWKPVAGDVLSIPVRCAGPSNLIDNGWMDDEGNHYQHGVHPRYRPRAEDEAREAAIRAARDWLLTDDRGHLGLAVALGCLDAIREKQG